MKNRPTWRSLAAASLVGGLLAGPAQAQSGASEASALRLRSLAASCAQCHGTDGHALPGAAIPGLAGRPAAELVRQMQAFRDGTRPSTVMGQLARGYNAGQVQQLGAYFAAQRR